MKSFGWTDPLDGGLYEFLRDWWRGYSDRGIETAVQKCNQPCCAGEWIRVTDGEMKAMRAISARQNLFDFVK